MFEFDYECPKGHPVLPGGKFCMECGSRVASGAAGRSQADEARLDRVPDGYAVVPEGYKVVPLPMAEPAPTAVPARAAASPKPSVRPTLEPVRHESFLASFLSAALAPVDAAPINLEPVELAERSLELAPRTGVAVGTTAPVEVAAPAAEIEAVDVAEMDGEQIDDALSAWLNDSGDGWRYPEYDLPEPAELEKPKTCSATSDLSARSSFGVSSFGFSVFPFFPGFGMISIGGGNRSVARRRGGMGFLALPLIFFLLSALGGIFSGPGTQVTVIGGPGVGWSNVQTVPDGTGQNGQQNAPVQAGTAGNTGTGASTGTGGE